MGLGVVWALSMRCRRFKHQALGKLARVGLLAAQGRVAKGYLVAKWNLAKCPGCEPA